MVDLHQLELRHRDLRIAQTVAADVTCHDKDAPGILYVLDPNKKKLKKGEIKPGTVKNVALVGLVGIPK